MQNETFWVTFNHCDHHHPQFVKNFCCWCALIFGSLKIRLKTWWETRLMLSAFIRLLKTHENPACRSGCIAKISPFIGWRHPWHRHTLLWCYQLQITKLNDKWVVDYFYSKEKLLNWSCNIAHKKIVGVYHAAKNYFARYKSWSVHMLEQSFFLWDYLLNAIWNSNATLIHFMTVLFYNCTEKIVKFKLCNAELFYFDEIFFSSKFSFLLRKYYRGIHVEDISFLFRFATSSYNGPTLHILM